MLTLNQNDQPLVFQDWGLIDYKSATEKQLELVNEVAEKNIPGYLIFCTHPPVVTTGRSTKPDDITTWSGEVVDVSRGGRATYHGPSQLVVYPIMNLKFPRHGRSEREIVGFLRVFENAIVKVMGEFGVQAQGRSLQKKENSEADETGVWVGGKKVASLGIAVKKWVTYHGAAINLINDPNAFQGIRPCGFSTDVVTTMESLVSGKFDSEKFKVILKNLLLKAL